MKHGSRIEFFTYNFWCLKSSVEINTFTHMKSEMSLFIACNMKTVIIIIAIGRQLLFALNKEFQKYRDDEE